MKANGKSVTRVTRNRAADVDPACSPDGRFIAFGSKRDGDFEIFRANTNGTGQAQLTHNRYVDENADWQRRR
jgi:TolB protein